MADTQTVITKVFSILNADEQKALVIWASHGIVWKRWAVFIAGCVCGAAALVVVQRVFHL